MSLTNTPSGKATSIDDVIPLPKDVVMPNELVFDLSKGIGTFSPKVVDFIEQAGSNP